jgi:hypothetical protein
MDALVIFPVLIHGIGLTLIFVEGIVLHNFTYGLAGLGIVFISDGLLIAVDYYEHRIPARTHD